MKNSKLKMLFVASLPSPAHNFDGERNKSKDVLDCLYKMRSFVINTVDYTKNKYIQTIKFLFLLFFKKYDRVFISKCLVGGSFAIHLIKTFFPKKYKNKIFYYLIGNGTKGHINKKIYKNDLLFCRKIIFESPLVLEDLSIPGLEEKSIIFPCIKPNYEIKFLEKDYSECETLNLIFFSRIHPVKGLDDAINAILDVNHYFGKTAFTLDIAGGISKIKEIEEYGEHIKKTCDSNPELKYLGLNLRINGINSYFELQKYDLHIFPSKFDQECAPGSVIDMFIAGVPTLSSEFPSARFIMNDNNSFFFKQYDYEDLVEKLKYIYLHKEELSIKRRNSFAERIKYFSDCFIGTLKENELESTTDD